MKNPWTEKKISTFHPTGNLKIYPPKVDIHIS